MLYNKEAVQANIRNRDGKRVFYLGKGHQLTSDARDYLTRERIEILPAEQAKPDRYQLLGGGYAEEKPEHMTHLHGNVLVPKTHPRILFRGAIDTLEAELLLCLQAAPPQIQQKLQEALQFARNMIRWEVLNEPVPEISLGGLSPKQIRDYSHCPQDFLGKPHFMPEFNDGACLLQINRARCAARHAEILAVAAFTDAEGVPTRPDLLQALNRMSSFLYILMIQLKT